MVCDSSSAGTQVYMRFEQRNFDKCLSSEGWSETLYQAIMHSETDWNQEHMPITLPPGIEMVLADICGGSSSTVMAKKVLQWKKSSPAAAKELWEKLSKTNEHIISEILALHRLFKVSLLHLNVFCKDNQRMDRKILQRTAASCE